MTDLLVPPDEIERLTGYKRPSRQVDELRRRGFHRARRNHAGQLMSASWRRRKTPSGCTTTGTSCNWPCGLM